MNMEPKICNLMLLIQDSSGNFKCSRCKSFINVVDGDNYYLSQCLRCNETFYVEKLVATKNVMEAKEDQIKNKMTFYVDFIENIWNCFCYFCYFKFAMMCLVVFILNYNSINIFALWPLIGK